MTLNRTFAACLCVVSSSALAQVVVPWASETASIPSTVAGDPTTVSRTLVLDDGGLATQTGVVGTDTSKVNGRLWAACSLASARGGLS